MIRAASIILLVVAFRAAGFAQPSPQDQKWIATSNGYARLLTEVEFKHRPEAASTQGLSEFDNKISQPTWADEDQERQEMAAVLAKLQSASKEEQDPHVAQDLQIMIRKVELDFK